MAHPYHHAVSSARRHGGTPEQYLAVHSFFDGSKSSLADFRHRALLHHTHGIFIAEIVFGATLTIALADGSTKQVPTRFIGEQHVHEDLGRIPTAADWLRHIRPQPWMNRARPLSRELEVGAR